MSDGGGQEYTVEKVALEKAKTAPESTASMNTTSDQRQWCQTISGGTSAGPLGPLKTIIDKELERSCVERSERVLADKAIANSSTEERKVRQQVEQRRKEREQLKVQKPRGKVNEMTSRVSDDDSQRQAMKSNDLLHIGQLKLTVLVCPQCKAGSLQV